MKHTEALGVSQGPQQPVAQQAKPEPEAVYTAEELMEAAESAFAVRPEVMAGAMRAAGRTDMTRSQAQAAINAFMSRKV